MKSRAIITASLSITLIVGVLNSLYKYNHLPRFRFFFGSGVLYLMLSGLAEFEAEVAQNLAMAILVFTVLGEGGGVLDHFLGYGTSKQTLDTSTPRSPYPAAVGSYTPGHPNGTVILRTDRASNAVSAPLGTAPIKPY